MTTADPRQAFVPDAFADYREATDAAVRRHADAGFPTSTFVARWHGAFNMAGGLWPVFHLRSFEAVTGKKRDGWLVKTVGLLLGVIGAVQIMSSSDDARADDPRTQALSAGTAAALLAIDIFYVARRRISKIYLLDAVAQAGWIAAWGVARAKR